MRYALDKLNYMHGCRDNFLCACLHDGRLHKRDISANISFMNVPVTEAERLALNKDLSAPEVRPRLRAEPQQRSSDRQLPAAE